MHGTIITGFIWWRAQSTARRSGRREGADIPYGDGMAVTHRLTGGRFQRCRSPRPRVLRRPRLSFPMRTHSGASYLPGGVQLPKLCGLEIQADPV